MINWPAKNTIISDLMAGVVVAMVLIPQAIAYSQLGGLPPQNGLYAAMIAPIIAALFGASKKLVTGPVAIISLITASTLGSLNITDPQAAIEYAILLAILVGLMQLLMGLAKFGVIINFISHPVMVGFSNAAAIIIATSQLPKIFGIKLEQYDHHYETMFHFILNLPTSVHLLSLLLATFSATTIILLKKINPVIPGVIIVMLISIIISRSTQFNALGGSIVGAIPSGLPEPPILKITSTAIPQLLLPAFVIAILGFMQTMTMAKSFAIKSEEKINPNREFIGQGIANLFSGAMHGYPVSGSFSLSAVNNKAGARTALSSISAGVCVLLAILFFTPFLYHLPQPVLAAIIITSVAGLLDIKKMIKILNTVKSDGIIAIITLISTLFFAPHLDKGILLGIALSTAYYIYTRTKPHVALLSVDTKKHLTEVHQIKESGCQHITIIRFDGSLFFANANYLETKIMQILSFKSSTTKYIILDARGINFIDSSGIEILQTLNGELNEIKKHLIIVRLKEDILEVIKRTDLYEGMSENIFDTGEEAVRAIYEKSHKNTKETQCPLAQYAHIPYDKN